MYRQVVGIPMGTNCAPLVAELFLYYYERGFILVLSFADQCNIIDMFNNTSRYLDDIFSMDTSFFAQMIPLNIHLS